MAVERPKYSVEISEPPFEIRDYVTTIVARAHVEGERSDAVSSGFRILANYIFGGNEAANKIAMTAPVTQTFAAKGAMSASKTANSPGWDVFFTMPASYTLKSLPKPKDSRINLIEMPRHRVAVVKFAGFWSDANLRTHEDQLLRWISAHRLTAMGAPTYAYYDPPWTPWFMRTIEVWIEVDMPRNEAS